MTNTDYRGTFRIDDISVNTDLPALRVLLGIVRARLPNATMLLAVSPLVHDMSREPMDAQGRIFPKLLKAMSDHRVFYRADRLGVPDVAFPGVNFASHGLLHVDHRLLSRDVQELSILASCSLVGSSVFVPPFNKYNRDTESICAEHKVQLVKWEDGWKHVGYNTFNLSQDKWYLHAHDTPVERFAEWLSWS